MKKRIFTILMMLTLILTLVSCGGKTEKSEGQGKRENQNKTENTAKIENFFQVAINGKVYSIPAKVDKFFEDNNGFCIEEDITDSRKEYWNQLDMYDTKKDLCFGTAFTYYDSSSAHTIADEYVYWLKFDVYAANVSGVKLEFYGGITPDSTYEDVVAIFGEPVRSGGTEGSMAYTWEKFCPDANEHCISELSVYFEEGKIDKVYLQHQTGESRFLLGK